MFANLGYVVIALIVVVALIAWRAKRPGESFEHAYERILRTDEHKAREAERLSSQSSD